MTDFFQNGAQLWYAFLTAGLLDVLRTALALGLGWAFWTIRIPAPSTAGLGQWRFDGENAGKPPRLHEIRPIADFANWGVRHPLIFGILSVFVLVTWGVIGRDYGTQGLFFDGNRVIQFGLGATAALVMLQVIYQYYALNTERPEVWLRMVEQSVLIGQIVSQPRGNRAFFALFPNGFLEELNANRLTILHKALLVDLDRAGLHKDSDRAWAQEVGNLLASPWMRIRFAPAALLNNTTMLFVLLGVIPWLFDPLERLPWLAGVLCGTMSAVVLAWATTSILRCVQRKNGDDEKTELLKLIDSDRRAPKFHDDAESVAADVKDTHAWHHRFFFRFFLVLFLIHATAFSVVVPWLSSTFSTLRGINVPTDSSSLTAPLLVLAVEVVLAAIVASLKAHIEDRLSRLQVRLLHLCGERLRLIVLGMVLLWAVPLGWWLYWYHAETLALRLLIAYLVCWFATFLIGVVGATWRGRERHGQNTVGGAIEQQRAQEGDAKSGGTRIADRPATGQTNQSTSALFSCSILLGGLACLVFWAEGFEVVIWPICIVSILAMLVRLWILAGKLGRRDREPIRILAIFKRAISVALGMVAVLGSGWFLIGEFTPVVACLLVYVMACAACLLPIWAGARPGMIYPASALFCYAEFAILYDNCSEQVQSNLPAAASFMMLLGVLAAGSFILRFAHRRTAPFSWLALIVVVLLLNGNAWMVEPNHFKLQFPGLEAYYRNAWPRSEPNLSPVYLDSRAYFRSTTSSVVKLRDQTAVKLEDERAGQVNSERPASATFMWLEGQHKGAKILDLGLRDTRGRVRPATGDSVRLILPEIPFLNRPAPGSSWIFPIPRFVDLLPAGHDPQDKILAQRSDAFRRWLLGCAQSIRVRPYVPQSISPASTFAGVETFARVGRGKIFNFNFNTNPPQLELSGLAGIPPSGILVALEFHATALDSATATAIIKNEKDTARGRPHSSQMRQHIKSLDEIKVVIRLSAALADVPGATAAEQQDMQARLRQQLDGTNLVLERLTWPLGAPVNQASIDAVTTNLALQPGDCVMLERSLGPDRQRAATDGGESSGSALDAAQAVPLEAFVVGEDIGLEPRQAQVIGFNAAALAPWLSRAAQETGALSGLSVRVAHTRGVFRAAGALSPPRLILFRGDRVREDDRLLLRWRANDDRDSVEHCHCVKVTALEQARAPNSSTATCVPIDPDRGAPWAQPGIVGRWDILMPLDSVQVLEAWRERMQPLYAWASEKANKPRPASRVKPPLIVVTVSGGGIRASVWAAAVLKRLELELGSIFPYHIRLITGASGGMVAASQFAASLPEPTRAAVGHTSTDNDYLDRLTQDQLDSVLGCLVYNDIPGLANPFSRKMDRGQKLEETWHRLTGPGTPTASPLYQSTRSYAADERAGWRPSLALTPMLVEDGRRLLISNLDLSFVSRIYGRILLERGDTGLDPEYFEDLSLHSSKFDEELFSLSAVEFWRLFPQAWDFRLSTAIRMSASFPWAAPPVSLPTLPPRRVVDAGYYDNYGVNLAALWMTKLRQWIGENTSGVLLVQIRDHVSQSARTQINFDLDKDPEYSALERMTWLAQRAVLEPGTYPINTPFTGISSAAQWSMSFRNDEQVEVFDRVLRQAFPESAPDFFRTVVFECPVEVSLSWKLDEREEWMISHGLGDRNKKMDDYHNEKSQVLDLLNQSRSFDAKATSNDVYREREKKLYYDALRGIGYRDQDIAKLSFQQIQNLYTSVLNNTLRLEATKGWWTARQP